MCVPPHVRSVCSAPALTCSSVFLSAIVVELLKMVVCSVAASSSVELSGVIETGFSRSGTEAGARRLRRF